MMNFLSLLRSATQYESQRRYESQSVPGVRFAVRKASLGQRIELIKAMRELTLQHEFLKAGDSSDQLEASLGDLLVRKLYLDWGLQELSGLVIDGEAADKEVLIAKGPEALVEEIAAAIQAEIELSGEERKNS
jgi:hypothetical protein